MTRPKTSVTRLSLPLFAASLLFLIATMAACPPPKMPTGPAPEYEDPPRPSWMKDGGAGPGPVEGPNTQPNIFDLGPGPSLAPPSPPQPDGGTVPSS